MIFIGEYILIIIISMMAFLACGIVFRVLGYSSAASFVVLVLVTQCNRRRVIHTVKTCRTMFCTKCCSPGEELTKKLRLTDKWWLHTGWYI